MLSNSNSSSSAEATIVNSPSKGDEYNSRLIFPPAPAQEKLAAGTLSSYSLSSWSSSSSSFTSSSLVEDEKEAKPPWLPDSYELNLNSSNSSPAQESPPQQESLARVNQNSEQTHHPIILIFRNQELGRHLLVLAIPMIISLSTFHNPKSVPTAIPVTAVALSLGVALIWSGILLRKTWPNASNWIELLGVAFMLLSFYGFVACVLPETLIWIPALCWLFNMLPFAVAYFSRERVLENGDTCQTSTNLLV